MFKCLSILTFLFFPAISFAQNISFYKEEITFQLDRKYFQVSGDYFFRNGTNGDIDEYIFYPVYKDSLNSAFDSLWIFDYTDNKALSYINKADSGIFFHLYIPAGDSAKIKIYYRQIHYGNYVKYILTTTRTWKKPLKTARYLVMVDKDINITSFSWPPRETIPFEVKTLYQWSLVDFMPDKDFEIRFTTPLETGKQK